jgi:hypothetical protein
MKMKVACFKDLLNFNTQEKIVILINDLLNQILIDCVNLSIMTEFVFSSFQKMTMSITEPRGRPDRLDNLCHYTPPR